MISVPGRTWPSALVVAFMLLLGCGAPAPTESPTASPPSNSSAGAEALPPSEVSPAAAAPPSALSLAEALAIGNLSSLKLPADANREYVTPSSYSFSAPVTAQRTVDISVSEIRAQLVAAGWKPLTSTKPDHSEYGAAEYYEKQGVLLLLSAGKSKGYAPGTTELTGEDVNAGAMLIGNIDARTLPLPPEAKLETSQPDSVSYFTTQGPLEIRKYYKAELPKQGWIEFSSPDIPGIEIPMEEKAKQQAFLQNGLKLELTYQPEENRTRVIYRLSLVEQQLPIPVGARSVEFGDDPPYLSCFSSLTLAEAKQFFTSQMPAFGWSLSEPVSKEPADAVLGFSAVGREPLWLGISEHDRSVTLQLKVDRE